jgi:hypothetical protein
MFSSCARHVTCATSSVRFVFEADFATESLVYNCGS